MQIIDGKETARAIKARIAAEVEEYKREGKRAPMLVAIIVGHDGGSETYVRNKMLACRECGFDSRTIALEDTATEEDLLKIVAELNADPGVDGFIVQLPLPPHVSEERITNAIDPDKDVDGFHPINVGRLSLGLPGFRSATPAGIMLLLDHYGIKTSGKNAVVIGRSNIVGKPMATMLMQKTEPGNCTVTVCHSATEDVADHCRRADIIIAAMGVPGYVNGDMVKEGAVVIDVGTTRVPDPSRKSGYRLSGDVDFESVAPRCSAITPVPGGVGPMTICSLMNNTMQAYRLHNPK